MKVETFTRDHHLIRYPAFYNAYPIHNEVHPSTDFDFAKSARDDAYFMDPYYGRIFDEKYADSRALYGRSDKMDFYISSKYLEIVDEFRVPYRKIPVFAVDNEIIASAIFADITKNNPDHKILLRGQTQTYLIERDQNEAELFFGPVAYKEPSFLPSHLRNDFDELFLEAMWQSQSALLFDAMKINYIKYLGDPIASQYLKSVFQIRYSFLITSFSLGIAQHYGLPSVGLDLTDNVFVAEWFACNSMSIDGSGRATSNRIESPGDTGPIIFVFRCPPDAVFEYRNVKPDNFPLCRPDHQDAWFGHVGWGKSANQLASYLVCAFILTDKYLSRHDAHLTDKLFPPGSRDPVLEYFIGARNNPNYQGEAKRALQKIYHFE